MLRPLILAAAVVTSVQLPGAQAQSKNWTQVGMLTCRLNPSIGFVIFGHQSMECRFVQNPPLPPQLYEGALNTVGIDIGVTAGGVMGWAVLSPTAGLLPEPLPANMSAPAQTSGWVLAPASMSWSAAPDAALPCNRSQSKGLLP
jgi:Protein of unknown function (DUF992)